MQNIKFDWNDISIIPAPISQIRSRSEINTFYNKKLPLIVSPMDTVIDDENINTFLQLGYEVCVPRGVNNKYDDAFTSYGIEELQDITIYNKTAETGIITFNIDGVHPHDAVTFFDGDNICMRAGHHCAQLIIKWLEVVATLRVSFYLYNTIEDCDTCLLYTSDAADE